MKKVAVWFAVISITIFVIAWSIIGLKIFDHNYDFITEAYIGYGSLAVFFASLLCFRISNRCPHCRRMKTSFGKYCPYCGKEIT